MAYDQDLANRIRELLAGEREVTEKAMFGGLAFLVGGNMAVAASGQGGLMVRVDPEATDALVAKPHARPFEMRGRAMPAGCGSNPRACEQAPARTLGEARRGLRELPSFESLNALDVVHRQFRHMIRLRCRRGLVREVEYGDHHLHGVVRGLVDRLDVLTVDKEVHLPGPPVRGVDVELGDIDRQLRRIELVGQRRIAERVHAHAHRRGRPAVLGPQGFAEDLETQISPQRVGWSSSPTIHTEAIERGLRSIRARTSSSPWWGVQPHWAG